MSAKGYRWLLAQKDAEIKRLRAKVARVEALNLQCLDPSSGRTCLEDGASNLCIACSVHDALDVES